MSCQFYPLFPPVPSEKRLWLIGGTSESAAIAEAIAKEQLPCTITVTTPTAKSLYPESPTLRIRVGSIDCLQLGQFCIQEQIVAVVDATHPYATVISQGAITVATARQIPYLRYERPMGIEDSEFSLQLDSFDTLIKGNYLLGQRVLLTIGYQALPLFQPWQNRATLFARLLPAVHSLEVAFSAGFTPDRIMAIRPPVSAELEKALWHHWQISLVVTKASGEAGGEEIKRSIAAQLGIPLVVIARPKIDYPQQTSSLSEVIAFCHQYL